MKSISPRGKVCCLTVQGKEEWLWNREATDLRYQHLQNQLREELFRMITRYHVRNFLCGMDLGVSLWAAEIILELKQTYPITLECVIPYETLTSDWTEENRDRYFSIVAQADEETMLQTRYTEDCEKKRDQYMVDHSDYVIAVLLDATVSTSDTLRYARRKRLGIRTVLPAALAQMILL